MRAGHAELARKKKMFSGRLCSGVVSALASCVKAGGSNSAADVSVPQLGTWMVKERGPEVMGQPFSEWTCQGKSSRSLVLAF